MQKFGRKSVQKGGDIGAWAPFTATPEWGFHRLLNCPRLGTGQREGIGRWGTTGREQGQSLEGLLWLSLG